MESEDLPDRRLKIGGYKVLDMHLQHPSRFYKKALFGKTKGVMLRIVFPAIIFLGTPCIFHFFTNNFAEQSNYQK
jgi:hypothetical protein